MLIQLSVPLKLHRKSEPHISRKTTASLNNHLTNNITELLVNRIQ